MEGRRLLLAFVLSLAVLLAWGYFFPPAPPAEAPPFAAESIEATPVEPGQIQDEMSGEARKPAAEVSAAAPEDEPAGVQQVLEPLSAEREQLSVVEGEHYRAEFSNRGAQLVSFQVLEHLNAEGGPVDLVRARAGFPFPYGISRAGGDPSALNDVLYEVERSTSLDSEPMLTYRYRGPEGSVEKRFVFRSDGLIEVEIAVHGTGPWELVLGPGIRNPAASEVQNRFARRSALYRANEEMSRLDPQRTGERELVSSSGLSWIGLEDTYFLMAFIPQSGLREAILQPMLVVPGREGDPAGFTALPPKDDLSEEQQEWGREMLLLLRAEGDELSGLSYWGSKQFDQLASLPFGLDNAVNLGWFGFLSKPLLKGLRWIHDNVVGNYGWAIILMTILIKLVLFPLTHKSTVSMQRMQKINPEIQAIRQKYRGKLKDKKGRPNAEAQRKMNEETMALYKREGVNPAGGCLPMLLQIPVLFAFYRLLTAAVELRGAPWIFWITDLSLKDPFYVLPIVMGASQFLQQKMTPAAGDPMQRKMFAMMPIVFTVLFLGFPSGLVLYWLTNNLLGIAQQYAYKRYRESRNHVENDAIGKKKRGAKS